MTSARDAAPLAALCHYYLSCLEASDTDRMAVFGRGTRAPDFVELPNFADNPDKPLDREQVAPVLSLLRADRSRLVAYVGYLCHVQVTETGRRIEPLLLIPVHVGTGVAPTLSLEAGIPLLNSGALRSLLGTAGALVEEGLQLEDDLGLSTHGEDFLSLSALRATLRELKPDWPWRDAPIGSQGLASAPPGLYARSAFFVCERSTYTAGLERELQQLALLPPAAIEYTALGAFLTPAPTNSVPSSPPTLLEALPLNGEQRRAVQTALFAPLSVISGPPGTGKSQVVADIVVNAAWHGQRVLFASKNNQAVDVVQARVNALGAHPVLLRLGAGSHEYALASYLVGLMGSVPDLAAIELYEAALRAHRRLEDRLAQLDAKEAALIRARNALDAREAACAPLRQSLPVAYQHKLKSANLEPIAAAIPLLEKAVGDASRDEQPLLVRMLWRVLYRRPRYEAVAGYRQQLDQALHSFGKFSAPPFGQGSLPQWRTQLTRLTGWLERAQTFQRYLNALAQLQGRQPLDELTKERLQILAKMRDNALELWERWVQMRPRTLSPQDKDLLESYRPTLELARQLRPQETLQPEQQRRYRELLAKVSHLLPCWATTSLSVRGRVPFEAGVFDLVVFDEASQADIASALPLLYRARRAVVIGDAQQLSHISGINGAFDQMLLRRFDLAETHAPFSYHYHSLFDLASSRTALEQTTELKDHHRSHADIIGFSNEHFYGAQLRVATDYQNLRLPDGGGGVRWIDVPGKVTRAKAGATNRKEAERLVQALRDLTDTGYGGSIGVVSPFRAQATLIRELLAADQKLSGRLTEADCLIDTVHKFQGDERDVVFFSPVLAFNMPSSAEAFLRKNGNLVNVAVTRARALLVVVGDRQCALASSVPHLAQFARYVDEVANRAPRRIFENPHPGSDIEPPADGCAQFPWEPMLYRALTEAGFELIPQFPEEKFVLTFALIHGERRLAINIDSEGYHQPWDATRCRAEQLRTERLQELGWDVLTFWVYEVRDDLAGCVEKVRRWASREA